MIFITKIFEKKIDGDVHRSFMRFSKGEFTNRAIMKITKSKNSFKIRMSYDLVKDTTRLIADNIDEVDVAGKLIKGKKKQEISATMSKEELQKVCMDNDFVLLDITAPNIALKCKKSIPKPGKELDDKFASAELPLALLNEFIFETDTFKQVVITHTFKITGLIIPHEYKNNAELARLHAQRKGKLVRILDIDGKHEEKEIDFIA